MFPTIISANALNELFQQDVDVCLIDCHFDLTDTELGRRAYREGHLPGAFYAHLDEDLSGEIIPGTTGRHPLPSGEAMATLFGGWGIGEDTQVVVYDDKKGAIASRLWWMLRFLGHEAVAVLDGGKSAWLAAGFPLDQKAPNRTPLHFQADIQQDWLVDVEDVMAAQGDIAQIIVDSRTAPRYRGEHEPIDPVAGHIPGAINLPFPENWTPEGLLADKSTLAERFANLPAPQTIFYCGSGVTACHNLLAYAHAGLGNAKLYAGSWSHWITDSDRKVG